MTREQREALAGTIGIMDMGAAILRKKGYTDAADVMVAQCELLQEIIDNDKESVKE